MRHLTLLLLLVVEPVAAQTFRVEHEKALWRDARGTIEMNDEGITYRGDDKRSHTWKYEDIQYFDRISEKEFVILSYEDQPVFLGRDRQYRFHILEGALTDDIFRRISAKMGKPVTNRAVSRPDGVTYELPVKHLHTFGGCEGVLDFTADSIYYVAKNEKDARQWRLGRDVQSIWSSDPYRLEILVYENNRREFSRSRVFAFDLKKPLDADFYRALKLKLLGLDSDHRK